LRDKKHTHLTQSTNDCHYETFKAPLPTLQIKQTPNNSLPSPTSIHHFQTQPFAFPISYNNTNTILLLINNSKQRTPSSELRTQPINAGAPIIFGKFKRLKMARMWIYTFFFFFFFFFNELTPINMFIKWVINKLTHSSSEPV
jgi:hypothetical protein